MREQVGDIPGKTQTQAPVCRVSMGVRLMESTKARRWVVLEQNKTGGWELSLWPGIGFGFYLRGKEATGGLTWG